MSVQIVKRTFLAKEQEGSLPGHILFNDFYNRPQVLSAKLAELTAAKVLIPGPRGKLTPAINVHAIASPWFLLKVPVNRSCMLWHEIYFRHFQFVPKGCLRCFKLVLTTHKDPARQKVSDLFRLRDFLLSLNIYWGYSFSDLFHI